MLDIRYLLYGSDYVYLFMLDSALKMFVNTDHLSNEVLYTHETPPDFNSVMMQLEKDGMIIINKSGVSITLNGKRKIRKGGYRASALNSRITFFLITLGTVASIIAILI